MSPAFLGEIALRAAIIQTHAGRVADARGRDRVPQQGDVTARREERPQLFACRRRTGE